MKTWSEIRSDVLALGFEKTKAWEKNKQSYVDAYNRAVGYIAATCGTIVDVLKAEKKKGNPVVLDLYSLAAKENKNFSSLSQTGITDSGGSRIDGTYITDNRFVHLPAAFGGVVNIYYYLIPARITVSAPDNTPCPLADKWRNILPYLMANRLYMDDDRAKAGYYWNLFDDMKNSILWAENLPVATVIADS